MNHSKKIYITGASGFLGRHVTNLFTKKDISFTGTRFDITNLRSAIKKMRGIDTLIHLAGNVRTDATDTAERHFSINTMGTLNILEAARINAIKNIIIASSTDVYNTPLTFYGQSKMLAEHLCRHYAKTYGISILVLRFTYLYGPGMHPSRIFSKMIKAAHGHHLLTLSWNQESFFDALYVKDAAEAICNAVRYKRVPSITVNISSAVPMTIPAIEQAIQACVPRFRIHYHKKSGTPSSSVFPNRSAKKYLHWKPRYTLISAIQDWYLSKHL